MRPLARAAVCGLALLICAPAYAQNLSLRAPAWAQALIAADITPTTGGRAVLAQDGVEVAVRVTIAPTRGGVARVLRYESGGEAPLLAVRRFTGHPSTGWWLWGPDTPRVTTPTAAQRQEIAALARAAMGVVGALGGASEEVCANGEQAYIEVAVEGRSTALSRACVAAGDTAGRLALRLSELAGSRTEEELAAAAVAELMAADRAFAAMAAADGVPAAFNRHAAENSLLVTSDNVATGRAGVAARFQNWPEGARLEWAPETARVSARGDMGWTWGNSTYIAPDGARTPGRYISVWTRDDEGNWRFAFDAPIR
jgi:ketosteroid isomerase-like protein